MVSFKTSLVLLASTLSAANPVNRRVVASLNEAATAEAHQRDNTATRALSNVQIKTSNGKCLRVDKLSGDFRANLTPIEIVDCGTTDGEGWDVITAGVHNDQKGQALIVSTLTQACFNFDPRRAAGNQVLLFSCGGRADGGGKVTNSQLFAFNGGSGPLSFKPQNDATKCLVAKGNVVDIANCDANSADQTFTFGNAAGAPGNGAGNGNAGSSTSAQPAKTEPAKTEPAKTGSTEKPAETTTAGEAGPKGSQTGCAVERVVTVTETVTVTQGAETNAPVTLTTSIKPNPTATTAPGNTKEQTTVKPSGAAPSTNPTTPVPVSRAGGRLNPSAAAEANQVDNTATRPVKNINIRAADGRCLSIDPTAGDFRQNLIPVQLAACSGAANQKFDVVTKGKHNDGKNGGALLVSTLTNGCLNFDGRRQADDTVIMFSCGGRADGSGQTNGAQLFPFKEGSNSIVLTPASNNNKTCLVAGAQRLESTQCNGGNEQAFEIVNA